MREDAATKATRLLVGGCLSIVRVGPAGVLAVVRGDTGMHTVRFAAGRWSCDCPTVPGRACSHAIAAARVVAIPGPWARAQGAGS